MSCRILVVDDDRGLSSLIRKTLEREGLETENVFNGKEAIARIVRKPPCLALLDYNLPDMDGRQVVEALAERLIKIPFIIMTGHGDEKIAVHMMKMGARDYLTKDSSFIDFLPSVVQHTVTQIEVEKRLSEAEKALRDREEKFRTIFENVNNVIVYVDTHGKILEVNKKVERMFGYKRDELIGKPFRKLNIFSFKDVPDLFGLFKQAIKKGDVADTTGQGSNFIELELKGKQGNKVNVEVTTTSVKKNGKLEGFLSIIRDITERKSIEKELLESEEKYRDLVDNSLVGVFKSNLKGEILFANEALAKMFECNSPEELVLAGALSRYKDPGCREAFIMKLKKKGSVQNYEVEAITKTGKTKNILFNATLDGDVISGMTMDITDRKNTEEEVKESVKRYRLLSEVAFDGIALTEKGIFLEVNKEFADIFGYNLFEITGSHVSKLIAPEYHEDVLQKIKSGYDKLYETIGVKKDGTRFPFEVSGKSFPYKDKILRITAIRDITKRKEVEKQIKASLKEKEVLLQEIHHRVKNNMTIISSLLKLQASRIKDEGLRGMFRESMSRIKSMALVHEKLYQTGDLANINFNDYLKGLLNNVIMSYELGSDGISLITDIENVSLGIDSAIPCGLIINELVSNSLKHAFPEGRKGDISVGLHINDKDIVKLSVSDNGIGMPEVWDFDNTNSLGLSLVNTLVRQLHGKIRLNREKGTEFQLTFRRRK
jgi:PAS domain S-box-containing protein